MDQGAFQQAVLFAISDVRREIALAKASETAKGKAALEGLGVQPGGGNFLAALGLLCYTEFAGKCKYNCKKANGTDHASENFNRFFDELGPKYKAFRAAGHKVYDVFRCGLAHEYFVKKSCTIVIIAPNGEPGLGMLADGRYYFAVERYCDDLEGAFNALDKHLFPSGSGSVVS